MSLSIGQVERERGDYIEIIKTDIKLNESPVEIGYKEKIFQCYSTISESLAKLYQQFKSDEGTWISISDSVPDSEEVLAIDKHGERYLAIYNDKFLTWHDSVISPLTRIENITHWMKIPKKP